MNKIAIITDSSCNLNSQLQKEYGVDAVLPMHIFLNDQLYDCNDDWPFMNPKDYYDTIRNGAVIKSAQVNSRQYKEKFKEFLDKGYDILSISCTHTLSSSVKESYVARDELAPNYPNQKIYCVDSSNCTFGLGMILRECGKLRANGETLENIVEWVEVNKTKFNEVGTVDKLTYLHRAGRISASKAFFGGLLGVKPIVIYDVLGSNVAVEKVKGRKNSFLKIVEYLKKYGRFDVYNDIYIAHADCPSEEIEELKDTIQAAFDQELKFIVAYIGPGVGSSVGPGGVVVNFYSDPSIREVGEQSK